MKTVAPAVNIVTRDTYPALNVKVGLLRHWPDAEQVAEQYGVTASQAEGVLANLWDIGVEEFWRDAESFLSEYLPEAEALFSDGRSGGWLVVHGLGDVAAWTVKRRRQWARFATDIHAAIDYRSGREWADETLAELADQVHAIAARERVRGVAPDLLAALRGMVDVFNVPEIDPLAAFVSIERARAVLATAGATAEGED